jgi:C4-dicarboxylate transporter DctM subunit
MNVVIALLLLIFCLVIGVPVALCFLVSASFLSFINDSNPIMLISYGFKSINTVLLLTIPLFVLAGSLINNGGLGEKLVGAVERSRMGKIRGGLGIVTSISCAVFGAVSGSSSATVSCIGSIMAPKMKENGYPDGLVGALVASTGVLGLLIPPSMLMILFAWAANVSVLGCFLATVVPGVLLTALLGLVNCLLYRSYEKKGMLRKKADLVDHMVQTANLREEIKAEKKARKSGESALPALLMPVIILGSIYTGWLTATEAAALSVFYAIPVGAIYYKKITWKTYKVALADAGKSAGTIMTMLLAVQILSRLYMTENLPDMILGVLTSVSTNKYVILLMINIFMVIMGMLMDDCSCTILLTPILLPVMTELGIHPMHYAAILGVNIGMGNITPPTAPLLYLSGRITGAQVKDMLKPTLIFIALAWTPVLLITTYWPTFSTFLPGLFGYM